MSAQHTPGPWWVRTDAGIPLQIMGSATEKDPQYNPVTRRGTTFIAPASDEAMANARLIAAAPELLDALQNLENDDGKIPEHAWKLVQDAIAKAKGLALP